MFKTLKNIQSEGCCKIVNLECLKKIQMNFRLGELFCGPGGIAVGAREAGFGFNGKDYKITHEWANDYDKDTCETYAKNVCPDRQRSVICKDIRKLDIKKLSEIDVVANFN